MSITRHKTLQGLASYERPKSVMQHEGLNGFFNALMRVASSSPSELLADENSETTDQAGKSTEKIHGDFMLASNYSSFDASKDFSVINTDLPESTRDALIEVDHNIQMEHQTNANNVTTDRDEIELTGVRNEGQTQETNKEKMEKFLTGNVFHNCTFNFGSL